MRCKFLFISRAKTPASKPKFTLAKAAGRTAQPHYVRLGWGFSSPTLITLYFRRKFKALTIFVLAVTLVTACTLENEAQTQHSSGINQNENYSGQAILPPFDTNETMPNFESTANWSNAANALLSPMLTLIGVDWVGNENPDVLVSYDFTDSSNPLSRTYYDRYGNRINEDDVPFLSGATDMGWAYANNFAFYDFNNDGIPEILITFAYPESDTGFAFLYAYIDREYRLTWRAQRPFVEFFAESNGHIIVFEWNYEDLRVNRIMPNTDNAYGFDVELLADWGDFWAGDYLEETPEFLGMFNGQLSPIEALHELHESVMKVMRQKVFN